MISLWYHGCKTEEERANRKDLVHSSTPVLDVLEAVLEKRRRELLSMREDDYNVTGWAYLAAHRNGRLEELDRLIHLLNNGDRQDD